MFKLEMKKTRVTKNYKNVRILSLFVIVMDILNIASMQLSYYLQTISFLSFEHGAALLPLWSNIL